LHISNVSFRVITYGMPRVGNQDFANYVDAHMSVTHINNKEDLVPIVPGKFSKLTGVYCGMLITSTNRNGFGIPSSFW